MNNIEIPNKGSLVDLTIESLAFGGMGVSHIGEMVVFVQHAIPGQKVRARILKKRKKFLEAIQLEILEESVHRAHINCSHFEFCGGCSFQNLDYGIQLSEKQRQVEDTFRYLGGFTGIKVNPILGCEQIYNYRNKMEFTYSNRRWSLPGEPDESAVDFALGLHVPGRYDKILHIDNCHIQHPTANRILNSVREMVIQLDLEPYDIKTHLGFMRNLIIRTAQATGEIMVNLVTSRENDDLLKPIVENLVDNYPEITSIVNNITGRRAGVSRGEIEKTLHGKSFITEKLGNFKFEISANSFFQTNSLQADRLYALAAEKCELTGREVLFDLYCGTGSIGICLSDKVKQVYGFELEPSAIADAHRNAANNKVTNAEFFEGDLMHILSRDSRVKHISRPDIVILDPPRAGLHENTIKDLLNLKPKKIVYISCNPSTQARDVKLLADEVYSLHDLSPVDMFPHTPHVENIAVLNLADSKW
ncbi:MAG: 23S rRNA (uracil(1939)-C(5))-methyltransferase RlmD [FCB group bacterium]|nr:23S rRNA (uracil(1939)-C(5))-methyltransferase RlmD [FCB group bacterium]